MADQTAFEILQSQLGVLAAPIRDYIEAVIKEQTPPVEEEPTPENPGEETPDPVDPPVDPEPTDPEEPPVEEPEPEEPTPVVPEIPSTPDTTTVYQIIDYTDGDFEHGINTKLNAVLIRDNNYVQAGHNLRFKNSQGSNITSTEKHQYGMLVKVNAVTLVPASHGAPGAVTLYNKYGKPIDPIVPDPVEETPPEEIPEPEPEEPEEPTPTDPEPPVEEEPEPEEPQPENPEQPLAELQVYNLEGNADWLNGVYKTNTMILLPIAEKDLIVQGAVIEFADGRRGTVNYVSKNTAGKRQSVKTELTGLDPAVVGYPHTVKVISSPIAEEPAPLPFEILPPGSLKKEGMAILGYNDGQSGGGDILRQTKMDYGWSNEEYVKKVAADKVTRVRNSLSWERIMPELFGEIDPKYGNEFLNQLKLYGKYGISVSVCMAHNYAGYSFTNTKTTRVQLGTEEVPQGALAHLARKFIEFVNTDPEARKYLFEIELMNEPINLPTPQLIFDEYQLCINAIREVDQNIWIGVDAYPWATTRDFKVHSLPLFDLKDPANKIRIHTHCYFDKGNGGSYTSSDSLINPEEVVKILDGVIDECQSRGWPHVFSEMGAPAAVWVRTSETDATQGYASPTPNALKALNLALQKALSRGSDVFIWWSSPFQANNWDNVLSIYAPRNADMRRVLLQYL